MCTYCGTDNYRKIYENHIGPIPYEPNGRTYDIHHIDGNRSNNDPLNLVALSIQDHYDLHYKQKDYGACLLISRKLSLSPSELSYISSQTQKARVENGTHPWQTRPDGTNLQIDRIANGTHHCHNNLNHPMKIRSRNGSHTWFGDNNPCYNQLLSNRHSSQKVWTCEHCGVSGRGAGNYTKYHGNNCHLINPRDNLPTKVIDLTNHSSQKIWCCDNCGKTGKGSGNYTMHKKKCHSLDI